MDIKYIKAKDRIIDVSDDGIFNIEQVGPGQLFGLKGIYTKGYLKVCYTDLNRGRFQYGGLYSYDMFFDGEFQFANDISMLCNEFIIHFGKEGSREGYLYTSWREFVDGWERYKDMPDAEAYGLITDHDEKLCKVVARMGEGGFELV